MSLQDRLDGIRRALEKKAGPEATALMHRATADLRATGIADRAVRAGQAAPPFALEDSRGRRVSLADLLRRGPVVVQFFRGHW